MKSGLYDCAGDSATASAAACAKRLLAPITNTANVYLGLMAVAAPRRTSWAGAGAGRSGSAAASTTSGGSASRARAAACATSTRSSTTRSCSAAAASSRLEKWPSIQLLVNSLGTPTTRRDWSCSIAVAFPIQVAKVPAFSISARRWEMVSQLVSAAGSRDMRTASVTRYRGRVQHQPRPLPHAPQQLDLQGFRPFPTQASTDVETVL